MTSKKVRFSDVYILHSVGSSPWHKNARRSYFSDEERARVRFFHQVEDWLKEHKNLQSVYSNPPGQMGEMLPV